MRKLGFDLGTKTCGFAISDYLEIAASPLDTIRFEENDFKKVIEKVEQILKEYNNEIDGFVLGYPLRSTGAKSERTYMVLDFAKILNKTFPKIEIFLSEEYGTTIQAESILKEAKLSNKKTRSKKDTLSAVIILNSFLMYGGKKWMP